MAASAAASATAASLLSITIDNNMSVSREPAPSPQLDPERFHLFQLPTELSVFNTILLALPLDHPKFKRDNC